MPEVLRNDLQEEKRVDQEVHIEELVKNLKENGSSDEEIRKVVDDLLARGEITEEDKAKAGELLKAYEAEERKKASELLGVDLTK